VHLLTKEEVVVHEAVRQQNQNEDRTKTKIESGIQRVHENMGNPFFLRHFFDEIAVSQYPFITLKQNKKLIILWACASDLLRLQKIFGQQRYGVKR